jgi:uncharacterized protein YndB with AHSA1/START domain
MTTMAKQEKSGMKVTTVGEREIHIERVFDAPRAKVWRAFTEPDLAKQWWGRGNRLDVVRFEFERGGHWRFEEHSEGQVHGFEGRFGDIEPQSKIVQTFEWDGMPTHVSLDTAEFVDLGDGRTLIRSTTLFLTREDRDGMVNAGMEGGLRQSYEALDALLTRI